MTDTWQTRTQCRKCAAQVLVTLEAAASEGAGLAVFYCPSCGERRQVEHPAGFSALSVTATKVEA